MQGTFATLDSESHWRNSWQGALCPEAVHLDKWGSKLELNDRLKRSMATVYGVQGQLNVKLPGSETRIQSDVYSSRLIRSGNTFTHVFSIPYFPSHMLSSLDQTKDIQSQQEQELSRVAVGNWYSTVKTGAPAKGNLTQMHK